MITEIKLMRMTFIAIIQFIIFTISLSAGDVYVIEFSGTINPISADYIVSNLKKAQDSKAECFIIIMDTPGGLDSSMREIVKVILNSDIPVITYIAPSGARSASAGVFITLASNIAFMAPGTNIGAAHPVAMGGEGMDEKMTIKVENDAVAYIKSIAEKRKRNVEWAEKAVKESVSATEREAKDLAIIDAVAKNFDAMMDSLQGREITIDDKAFTLDVKSKIIKRLPMTFKQKFLFVISEPTIAYILLILGFYGLFFEIANPGVIFPGVIGGICIIIAFTAFQTLPINYAGVALILLALVLFILEVKIISHGALTIGGIVSMTIGSIMLVDSELSFMSVSLKVIIPVVLFSTLFFLFAVTFALKAQKRKSVTGKEGLIGEEGLILKGLKDGSGQVFLHGEYWTCSSVEELEKGDKVKIIQIDRMKLIVKKLN